MSEKSETPSVKKSKAPLYVSIGFLLILLIMYIFFPPVKDFLDTGWEILTSGDKEKTRLWISQFSFWGPIIIITAMILQMFLLVIPTPVLMVISILAYGPILGSLILLTAIFLASSIGYSIGRYFGPAITDKLIGRKTEKKIASFIEDYGFWVVIVVRLSPFLSNDAISFVGGILKMGYWKFIMATMFGISPLIVFIAFLGENYERMKSGLLWASLISIFLFIFFVWWDKKIRKNKP